MPKIKETKREKGGEEVRRYLITSALVVGLASLFVVVSMMTLAYAQNQPKAKEFRIERSMPKEAVACIECHKMEHPGIFGDWANSRHANANVTCYDCHKAESFDPDVSKEHYKQYERGDYKYGTKEYKVPVAAVVTPKDCSRCHPDEAKQYARSKHANTHKVIWQIDPWLKLGMNSDLERATGCFHCHGTILKKTKDGNLDPMTWPNVGVGRINFDGSLGSCTSCHTRHRFSVMEARKPEACGQCHLGPDHPQIEIFMESKHGDIYTAFGDEYNWNAAPGTWSAGVDFRGPTCAVCHMSGAGTVLTSHDVTERLAWESQAPLSVRPENFKPFPAKVNHEVERAKMKEVCKQCHGKVWVDDHFVKYDKVNEAYNDIYFKPAKKMLDDLYAKGLLDKSKFFDEELEVEFYELWHHEGRRARFGAAMMAPDYTWWHGFYECKKRFVGFIEGGNDLIEHNKKAYVFPDFPAATGNTTPPAQIFGKGK
jgi:ssDNA-binding Zn-finger/Zn-ribbon topoisomerase 1